MTKNSEDLKKRKQDKRAAALRENLKKRKTQARQQITNSTHNKTDDLKD